MLDVIEWQTVFINRTTHVISIEVPSVVTTNTKDLWYNETKDDKLDNIRWEDLEPKSHKEHDIPEELEDEKPILEADIACCSVAFDRVAKNFWNCSNMRWSIEGTAIMK